MVYIVFIHPDLGIGGAERLVIDAALALKKKGHEVKFITAHHDPNHCFPETINGQLDVTCAGDWLPRSTFGSMFAFWAYVRMIYIAFYFILFAYSNYEVAFVDQISACIPILRLRRALKIIFYCHYPDQLLTDRKTLTKKIYRNVIDTVEESTTAMADTVLVNSKFTASVYASTFKSISKPPRVLYPSIDFSKFDKITEEIPRDILDINDGTIFLSLNRYERKKNIALAIEALKYVLDSNDSSSISKIHLVIAGGYDDRVKENIEYYNELVSLTCTLQVENNVIFMKSPSDDLKLSLFKRCDCLLYTPDKEHFGIVPLEAMYMGTPVIAVNSGGPVETVIVGKTGFLRDQTFVAFAEAMQLFVDDKSMKGTMSTACKEHVTTKFSCETFAQNLDDLVLDLIHNHKKNR